MTDPIRILFQKYLDQEITTEELDELLGYFNDARQPEVLRDMIQQALAEDHAAITDPQVAEILKDTKLKLEQELKPRVKRLRWIRYAAAACIPAVLGLAIYLYQQKAPTAHKQTVDVVQDIPPGGNKAILTLSNGRQVPLENGTAQSLHDGEGILISGDEAGNITYNAASTGNSQVAAAGKYNTLSTPKGGQFSVVLPDGSKVWLNAASEIRYALDFGTGTRTVELKGEAFFEVPGNKNIPFKVRSAGQEITVLGTKFNINAYANEPHTTTTLLDGSVIVTGEKSGQTVRLKPGSQATLRAGGITVSKVNTDDLTAWKEGLIVLSNADLAQVMRQIERWYDVEFDTSAVAGNATFSGELPRNIKLSELLKALRVTTGMNFKVEGRRIVPVK